MIDEIAILRAAAPFCKPSPCIPAEPQPVPGLQSTSESCRMAGNARFKRKSWSEACHEYSSALRNANLTSPAERHHLRSLALANRSAALVELRLYGEALIDIDLAIDFRYPPNLMPKLLRRRASCILAIWRNPVRSNTKQAVPNKLLTSLDERLAEGKLLVATALEDALAANLGTDAEKTIRKEMKEWEGLQNLGRKTAVADEPASLHQHAVADVDAQTSDRRLLAAADISAGSVIISELPLAAMLDSACFETRCFECIERLGNAPFPCDTCVTVWYCSMKCKIAGTRLSKSACQLLHSSNPDKQRERLSIKLHFHLEQNTELYSEFLKLKSHIGDRPPSELGSILGSFQTLLGLSSPPSDQAIQLTRVHCRIGCNSFSIKSVSTSKNAPASVETTASTTLGSAVYLHASLLNHSCDPNCISFFDDDARIRIQTSKPVLKSQQLAISYHRDLEQAASIFQSSGTIAQQKRALDLVSRGSHPLGHQLCELKDALAQAYANIGDFENAANLVESTFPGIRAMFGSESVEHAQEKFKLCTLLYSAKNRKKLKETGSETLRLYKLLALGGEEKEELEWMMRQ
ncbi:hypothetical protein HDU98_009842 [Podochytrium sp. JEL0797]|nr:hypothetical protein HDU98_009842 [Podochytrium sp. JEL0797]